MILGASWRMNHHHRFISYGIGFYVKNDTYVKESVESEETCSHKRKWKRDEGWTQCRDCFKILETKKSLMMGIGNQAIIRQVKKMRREYKKFKKQELHVITEDQLQNMQLVLPVDQPISEPVEEPIIVHEIIPDIRSVNDLYNNFFRK